MHRGKGLLNDGQVADGSSMPVSRVAAAFRKCVLALALVLSGPVLADGFTCAPPADAATSAQPDVLDEVVVTAEKATTRTSELQAWLRHLLGRFTYTGYIDLCGNGNADEQRPVTGIAECTGFPSSPTVHCTVNVRWPAVTGENGLPVMGGVSTLLPAVVSYSLESRHIPDSGMGEAAFRAALRTGIPTGPSQTYRWGLMFTQVDNRGIAEWGSGDLVGDTFISTEPCVGIPGACQKITRITARPQSNEVAIVVDIAIDSRRVLRQAFLLHRMPHPRTNEDSEGVPP